VQPCRVIPREHLPMRAGAPLQRRDIVANKRVHHMVGGEVVVVEVLDPLYCGLHTGHAHGEVQTERVSGKPVGSA
jgi:hypothetical protein